MDLVKIIYVRNDDSGKEFSAVVTKNQLSDICKLPTLTVKKIIPVKNGKRDYVLK